MLLFPSGKILIFTSEVFLRCRDFVSSSLYFFFVKKKKLCFSLTFRTLSHFHSLSYYCCWVGRALRMACTSSATAIKQNSNCWRFWTIPPLWSRMCSKVAAMSISLQPLERRFKTMSAKNVKLWRVCQDMICQCRKGLSRYERLFKLRRVCQGLMGLSTYNRFVKIWRVCQNMMGLSTYNWFVNAWRFCRDIKGLSRYEGFIKIWRVCQDMTGVKWQIICQGMKGLSGYKVLNSDLDLTY